MEYPIPQVEPLVQNLKKLNVGDYLKSREFKRYCLQASLADYWRDTYDYVKRNRRVVSVGMDHEKYDSIDALILMLNDLFENHRSKLFIFLPDFINNFYFWQDKRFDLELIIEDLELLGCPNEAFEFLKSLNEPETSTTVPKIEFDNIIDNYEKLNNCITKMDESIKKMEYNLTLTYAYSSLEGIFKAYIKSKGLVKFQDENELGKISKIVKDSIKNRFDGNDEVYPEQIINLISTITNAVSNARNSFSDSHFDKEAEKWLAEFVRDSVNSIGRLIINFIK